MRWAVTLAVLVTACPAEAGCHLSPTDCTTLFRAMTEEAYAGADDEQNFRPAGLSRGDRGVALERRHLDRIDEHSLLLPDKISNEWMRLEACNGAKPVADAKCD